MAGLLEPVLVVYMAGLLWPVLGLDVDCLQEPVLVLYLTGFTGACAGPVRD